MSKRKYFGTDGIRGEVGGATINAEFALRLGYAAGRVLSKDTRGGNRPTVVIGKRHAYFWLYAGVSTGSWAVCSRCGCVACRASSDAGCRLPDTYLAVNGRHCY